MRIRVWYKLDGKLDSCIVNATSKEDAKKILKSNLPRVEIGHTEKA